MQQVSAGGMQRIKLRRRPYEITLSQLKNCGTAPGWDKSLHSKERTVNEGWMRQSCLFQFWRLKSAASILTVTKCFIRCATYELLNFCLFFLFFFLGLFLILGLILYPAGWGCQKAISYCGHYASAYKLGDCSLGWAFYTAIGGTILTFICAVFSAQAEIATSSDKVQEEIEEGKNLICLL